MSKTDPICGVDSLIGERRLQNKLYAHLNRRLYHWRVVSKALKSPQEFRVLPVQGIRKSLMKEMAF